MTSKKILAGIAALTMIASVAVLPVNEGGIIFDSVISAGAETSASSFKCIELEDGTIEISSYTGRDQYVTIPSTIDGKTVSSIGYSAFYYNSRLLSVTIPDTVTNIGDYAFGYSSNLKTISIPSSVKSIGSFAFSGTS